MNLDNVKTENFTFKKYNSKNKNHLNLLRNIANDNLTQDFFSEWKELLFSNDDFTYGYIVEKDNDAIGLITINEIDDRNVVFSHVISPQYRGNRYSSLIKKELYDYIFKNNLLLKSLTIILRVLPLEITSFILGIEILLRVE